MVAPSNNNLQSVISAISSILQNTVSTNDRNSNQEITVFHASNPPSITIKQYLERIVKYANITPELLTLSLIYLERLLKCNTKLVLSSLSVHRCIITAVVIASKYASDVFYNNTIYARIGGLPVLELNSLEVEFLHQLKYHLYVSTDLYSYYEDQVTKRVIMMTSQRASLAPMYPMYSDYSYVPQYHYNPHQYAVDSYKASTMHPHVTQHFAVSHQSPVVC